MEVRKIFTTVANKKARNTNNVVCKGCGEVIPEQITSEEYEQWRCEGLGRCCEYNENTGLYDVMCYEVDGMKGYAVDGKCLHYCPRCTCEKEYHDNTRRENIDGTYNHTWIRRGDFSLEIETCSQRYSHWEEALLNDMDFAEVYFTLLMLGYQKNGHSQHCEKDCTNHGEHHARGESAEGISKWFHARTEAQLDTMRDERCGCHMHVNCNYRFSDDIWFQIWNPVFQYMKFEGDTEKMIEFWGRTFTHYASMNKGYHGDAINWHTGHNTVEFRLPHVVNADQIIRCLKFWRACVNVVNKAGHKVQDNPNKAAWLGRKIVRECFIPLVNGTKFYKGY